LGGGKGAWYEKDQEGAAITKMLMPNHEVSGNHREKRRKKRTQVSQDLKHQNPRRVGGTICTGCSLTPPRYYPLRNWRAKASQKWEEKESGAVLKRRKNGMGPLSSANCRHGRKRQTKDQQKKAGGKARS